MESVILEKNNNNPKFSAVYNDSYNDEFHKDSVSKEYSRVISPKNQPHVSDDEQVIISSVTSPNQTDQHWHDRPENDHSLDKPSDTDSEPETDTYHVTEDQQRAMMELMVQKQEAADLLDEEPPEYNVKGRLEQLNAELAKDPTPVDESREHRVGFKAQIVDLVAPPPVDFSDDESQPNSVSSALRIATALAFPKEEGGSNNDKDKKNDIEKKDENKENVVDSNSKEFVVERDGQFALLSANELSQSERLIFLNENETEKTTEVQSNGGKIKTEIDSNKSHSTGKVKNDNSSSQVLPRPPLRPRPNTAFPGPRRNVQPLRSQVTRSAVQPSNCNTILDNSNYNSPYAMTPQQKEEAKEKARILEEEKKEKERKIREEAEEKKRESNSAFQAWLCKKKEENRKRQGAEAEKQKSEQERTEEKEEVYKAWLKEKKAQGKKEKLLKRRQQQEKSEGLFYHSSEECEKAFKEWLKKKNAASKKQMATERQMNRMYKIQVKRSKKIQAIIKALKESQADQYSDNSDFRY